MLDVDYALEHVDTAINTLKKTITDLIIENTGLQLQVQSLQRTISELRKSRPPLRHA
jgi:regulator of replication initiation timing